MRRVRYSVAMSLDGFIAGPNGEADWIVRDPDIDFAAMFREFDAFLIGRKTYEAIQRYKGGGMGDAKVFVFPTRCTRPRARLFPMIRQALSPRSSPNPVRISGCLAAAFFSAACSIKAWWTA
jgi:dihydrofolate reductase